LRKYPEFLHKRECPGAKVAGAAFFASFLAAKERRVTVKHLKSSNFNWLLRKLKGLLFYSGG